MLRWRDRGEKRLDWRDRHEELAELQALNLISFYSWLFSRQLCFSNFLLLPPVYTCRAQIQSETYYCPHACS